MTGLRVAVQVGSVVLTVLAAWVVPAWGMRALVPVLERTAPRVRNYRGTEVPVGLGIVWALWCAGLLLVGAVERVALWTLSTGYAQAAELRYVLLEYLWPIRSQLMVLLVLAAFAFGAIDDAFGDSSAKGFRGHAKALFGGRLTTGMLKLIGIGSAAAWVAVGLAVTEAPGTWLDVAGWVARWVVLVAVIALSANLINLLDLRPGRALKAYLIIGVPAALSLGAASCATMLSQVRSGPSLPMPLLEPLGGAVSLLVLVVGPALAVWRFDLGESGMLGDGGANAAGALAGYLFAAALPTWGLVAVAVVLLCLNVFSEKVSFSRVIGENPMLSWFDGLGRVRHDKRSGDPPCGAAETAGETGEGPGAAPGADMTEAEDGRDGGTSQR